MTTTIIDTVPLTIFTTGQVQRSTRAVPAGFQSVTVQLNPTTGNSATPFQGIASPFNSPTQTFAFGSQWSWDGGASFPGSSQSTITGSPTGQWPGPKGNTMSPVAILGMPSDANRGGAPNAYRAYAALTGGPASTAITISETTG